MLLSKDTNTAHYQIQAFEPGKVKINQDWQAHSVLIHPDFCQAIPCANLEDFDLSHVERLWDERLDMILLGTGPKLIIPSAKLRAAFLSKGMGFEFMDSAAACRTYQILTAENRPVAAIILVT